MGAQELGWVVAGRPSGQEATRVRHAMQGSSPMGVQYRGSPLPSSRLLWPWPLSAQDGGCRAPTGHVPLSVSASTGQTAHTPTVCSPRLNALSSCTSSTWTNSTVSAQIQNIPEKQEEGPFLHFGWGGMLGTIHSSFIPNSPT